MTSLLRSEKSRWIPVAGVLLAIFVVLCLNATRSGLWYDESIEYFYSRVTSGPVPGGRTTASMYERITETYQPPLYNWLMHLWLLAFDSELGFRLAGIITTVIGGIGLFLALKKITDYKYALIGMAVYLLTGRVSYQALECAEYNLLLCMLCWTSCFYLHAVMDGKTGHIAGFFVFACLSVYSQYGAAFIILPMYCSLMIHYLRKKEKIKELLIMSGITAIAAGLLIVFFLIPQLNHQGTTGVSHYPVFRYGNPFIDFFRSAATCMGLPTIIVCLCIAGAVIVPFLVKDKKHRSVLIHLLAIGICAWVVYYIAVACSFYGYNSWDKDRFGTYNIGGRYFLFFTPFIILFSIGEIYWLIKTICGKQDTKEWIRKAVAVCLILFVLIYCGMGIKEIFTFVIKDDIREVEKTWMDSEAYSKITLVHQWQDAGFQYYLTHDGKYDENYQKNIVTADKWIHFATEEEMIRNLSELGIFGLDEFVYVGSRHYYRGSYDAFLSAAEKMGYKVDKKYEGNSALLFVSKE